MRRNFNVQRARKVDVLRWVDLIDVTRCINGASTGFSVLVLGGLLSALVVHLAPVVGYVWLPLTAVVAFATAAARPGKAIKPSLHGAISALSAYLLVLPLVILAGSGNTLQIVLTTLCALVVGGIAGHVCGNRPYKDK